MRLGTVIGPEQGRGSNEIIPGHKSKNSSILLQTTFQVPQKALLHSDFLASHGMVQPETASHHGQFATVPEEGSGRTILDNRIFNPASPYREGQREQNTYN